MNVQAKAHVACRSFLTDLIERVTWNQTREMNDLSIIVNFCIDHDALQLNLASSYPLENAKFGHRRCSFFVLQAVL
jgi:hypothetical protein